MVTAILPSLTDDNDKSDGSANVAKPVNNPRHSIAMSLESDMTITPARYRIGGNGQAATGNDLDEAKAGKPSALAGYVGLFTGCGALVALSLFLPLPARFGEVDGVTPGKAVEESFYVVGIVAFVVAIFVFFGLRNLKGEEGKGWNVLLGLKANTSSEDDSNEDGSDHPHRPVSQLAPNLGPHLTTNRRFCLTSVSSETLLPWASPIPKLPSGIWVASWPAPRQSQFPFSYLCTLTPSSSATAFAMDLPMIQTPN